MWLRTAAVLLAAAAVLEARPKWEKRLEAAAEVFYEIMEAPEQSIPQELLNRAECVIVIPGAKKGAFIFGGKYGRGFVSCRKASGIGWSAPAAVRIEGFNFGLQAGGTETDLVMLVMNRRGMKRLLKSKFTIGGDAAAAAGPVGRTLAAGTDVLLTAEILSWSRARGVFAGIALDGATLREDRRVNERLYGRAYSNRQILESDLPIPEAGRRFVGLLNRYSSRKGRGSS